MGTFDLVAPKDILGLFSAPATERLIDVPSDSLHKATLFFGFYKFRDFNFLWHFEILQ